MFHHVWKFSAETLSEPLTKLFNYCLEANEIPSESKFAIVNPLFKSKDQLDDMNNYPSISLLPPIAKIFEKLIQQQVLKYFTENTLFHKSQHGFRAGFSCESALHELISLFKTNIEKKWLNVAIFINPL
jgi:hypothetical protein